MNTSLQLLDYQQRVVSSTARYRICVWAAHTGKTTTALAESLIQTQRKNIVLYIADNARQADRFKGLFNQHSTVHSRGTGLHVIETARLRQGGLAGLSHSLVIIDDAPSMQFNDFWHIWNEVSLRNCRLLVFGTPVVTKRNETPHWFHNVLFAFALGGSDYMVSHVTMLSNPLIHERQIESLEHSLSKAQYEANVLANFAEWEDAR